MTSSQKADIIQKLATVAQSVEQLIRNQQVAGSSPASSSKKSRSHMRAGFFILVLTDKIVIDFTKNIIAVFICVFSVFAMLVTRHKTVVDL